MNGSGGSIILLLFSLYYSLYHGFYMGNCYCFSRCKPSVLPNVIVIASHQALRWNLKNIVKIWTEILKTI